jgi:hypothetical protein
MTERTRRATEAVETHLAFLDQRFAGSQADRIEGNLLDPARDRSDPRYGHEQFLYADGGGTFQGWLRAIADRAMTFTATTDLMREIVLTQEMMTEEGLDYLPLLPHHVPAKSGIMFFPYGVEHPFTRDLGQRTVTKFNVNEGIRKYLIDDGCGDRHFIDGFLWDVNDRVSKDGHGGAPVNGITVILLTRWRGRADDRPFRLHMTAEPDARPPEIVGSDMTAWAFDEPGQEAWINPDFLAEDPHHRIQELGFDKDELIEHLEDNRWFIRSLVWSTFRWLSEEVWLGERADRATSRRLQRARPDFGGRTPEDGDILIVDLRKERKDAIEAAEGEGIPPWWRCRWTVRGHWAKRRTSIIDANGHSAGPVRGPDSVEGVTFAYKHVWIEPYIKGPDDAPLVYKDKVGVLDR